MRIKSKLITKTNPEYIAKIINHFNISKPINPNHMTELMEFYIDKELIGIVNYLSYPVLDYEKIFIRSIYYISSDYLDAMVKIFINKMKPRYNAIYTNVSSAMTDKNIINTLLQNDFYGNDILFLRY
jgi:hypothetical protein